MLDEAHACWVELGGGLIEDQVLRSHREDGPDDDELGLTAGQARRILIGDGAQIEQIHHRGDPPDHFLPGKPEVHRPEGDLLPDGAGQA